MITNENYYNQARAAANNFWRAYHQLKDMQTQWNALDYGHTLNPGQNGNDGLVAADLGAAIFATTDAVTALFVQGHATNIAKILP